MEDCNDQPGPRELARSLMSCLPVLRCDRNQCDRRAVRVLVTGGAGFLGSYLVHALVGQGHDVVVFDNLRRGHRLNLPDHASSGEVHLLVKDIRHYPSVLAAMVGVEVAYHLAAQSNVIGAMRDIDYSFTTNVIGTFNVLKAASKCGVRRVVFASSREVYGEPERLPVSENASLRPKNAYGASKAAAEAYCRAWATSSGCECQILRFANVYGPHDRDRVIPTWLARARRGDDLELYGGQQILDFLWVDHAVRALIAAAACENSGPVNVASGRGVRLVELAERIIALTGNQSVVRPRPVRDVEVVRFVAEVSHMREVLGIEPPEDPLSSLHQMIDDA
ncbi:MAG: NAD-dependent epimerase/dehydratase family protein [Dehalococcoidia bacterium]|nr:NAD-dependent epimerase/dehydratase family protein [Dehalococcoidia bacterium]